MTDVHLQNIFYWLVNHSDDERLLSEMNKPNKYNLKELFQIRDALNILAKYGLHDKDLLYEVNKFIEQELPENDPNPDRERP